MTASKKQNIKRKIPVQSLGYRPKLEDLEAFSNASDYSPINIEQLTQAIPISAKADYLEEIYAIIPVQRNARTYSSVI